MKHIFALTLLCALGLLVFGTIAAAQEAEPTNQEQAESPPEDYEQYTVKAYSITVWGGWFSGTTFLDLQPLADRTQLEEGSNDVYKYDGTIFTPQELSQGTWTYDGARKEILPGYMVGGRLGIYMSDKFHLDIVGAYGKSQARTTFINSDPDNLAGPYREELDRDDDITIFQGGLDLCYDATSVRLLGLSPFIGFGIGGVINRFTYLEDKTALYFQLLGGLNFNLSRTVLIRAEVDATTFSFSREELHYGKQATYLNLRLGLTWLIDVVPTTLE